MKVAAVLKMREISTILKKQVVSSALLLTLLLLVALPYNSGAFVVPGVAAPASCGISSSRRSSTTTASSSSSSSGSDSRSKSRKYQEKATSKRTLYEILGAPPTATRSELKQRYVVLARKSHPDALISRPKDAANGKQQDAADSKQQEEEELEFTEIAAAWRILSDETSRRRYDRSLKAEQLSGEIAAWADDVASSAKPAADLSVELLEKFAIPLFRRTTATTLASFQAAAQEFMGDSSSSSSDSDGASASTAETKNGKDLSETAPNGAKSKTQQQQQQPRSFQSTLTGAFRAAQRAGQAVDKMELLEKSDELQQQAVQEYQRACDEKDALQDIVKRRLKLSLHTPNSGMTSNEALIILEEFNRTVADTTLSLLQRALFHHTVEEEIKELQKAESAFVEVQKVDSQAQDQYRKIVRERLVATNALEQAEKEQEAARLAYEEAQKRVAQQREEIEIIGGEVVNIEALVSKSSYGMERQSVLVQHQSERVRNALRQKEKEVYKAQTKGTTKNNESTDATPPLRDPISGEEIQARLDEMEELRQEERRVSDRYSSLEVNAARLLSKANSYKKRAEKT